MNMCTKCSNYICKAYKGTCCKYRIIKFLTFWRKR